MKNRITILTNNPTKGNVLYICMRDQRIFNNHSINYGYNLSYHYKSEFYLGIPVKDVKCNEVQHSLMLENIEEMRQDAEKYNLYFTILENVEDFILKNNIKNVILDWSPLRECKNYCAKIADLCKKQDVFCVVIDSHNVVPCKILEVYKRTSSSVKMQLFKYFFEYLDEYDEMELEKAVSDDNFASDDMKCIVNVWNEMEIHKYNDKEKTNKFEIIIPKYEKCKYFQGGHKAGSRVLEDFFTNKFSKYNEFRNSADVDGLSNLSPYLHLGILSPQKIIKLAYEKFYKSDKENLDGYISEIFIWRETAEHFCYHNENYDNIMGALEWARNSLQEHASDKREHLYTRDELEFGKTQDRLWNAAQKQLISSNKIHGYVRMYWAKQLVKWTKTPEDAIEIGIGLNDKYSVDGNDPNGYLGVMWCICGSMDRGYKDRPMTGKIRPMNKIKTNWYERMWNDEEEVKKYLKTQLVKRDTNRK